MKLFRPVLLAFAGLAFLAAPAGAAPYSNQYTNVVQALESLAESETDPAKDKALADAIAFFANTSKSYAADMTDMVNAIKKLEAAYGTSSESISSFLDSTILGTYVLAFGRAQQAYVGAALKETQKGNYSAIAKLAKAHTAKLNKANKFFPSEPPSKPITRAQKLNALKVLDNYGVALAKRYKVALNQP